jgi:hypothetical protein
MMAVSVGAKVLLPVLALVVDGTKVSESVSAMASHEVMQWRLPALSR